MLFATGDRYEGSWYADKKHGGGIFVWINGTEYNGELEEDAPLGSPIDVNVVGDMIVEGADKAETCEANIPCFKYGHHTFKYANGDMYEGEWLDGRRHGTGVYTWASGDEYYGDWANGNRHGKGVFEGEWRDGFPQFFAGDGNIVCSVH